MIKDVIFVDPSLRSTGIFALRDGVGISETITTDGSHIEALGTIARAFEGCAKLYKLLVIEDYAFGKASQSVSKNAEVGGIIRGVFSMKGIPILEMPISVWKSISNIRLKKETSAQKRVYREVVGELAGDRYFDSTDACDAWLLYYTTKYLLHAQPKTDAQKELKAKLQELEVVL